MTTTRRILLATMVLAAVVSLTACDRSATTAPDGPEIRTTVPAEWPPAAAASAAHKAAGREFYPLEVGNSWHYARTDRFQAVEGGVPQTPEVYTGTVTEELTQIETVFDRDYVVSERHIVIPGLSADDTEWIRYRQDKAGLYEAVMSIHQPPGSPEWISPYDLQPTTPPPPVSLVAAAGEKQAAAIWSELWARYRSARIAAARGTTPIAASPPGGVLSEEVVRLDYPLHPGASWTILEAPLFTATVEAHETLDLAGENLPTWRTRLWNESMGPDDSVLIWYGPKGTAQYVFHFESVLIDPAGNPVGTYLFDTEEVLDGFDLAGPGGGPVTASARGIETADGL